MVKLEWCAVLFYFGKSVSSKSWRNPSKKPCANWADLKKSSSKLKHKIGRQGKTVMQQKGKANKQVIRDPYRVPFFSRHKAHTKLSNIRKKEERWRMLYAVFTFSAARLWYVGYVILLCWNIRGKVCVVWWWCWCYIHEWHNSASIYFWVSRGASRISQAQQSRIATWVSNAKHDGFVLLMRLSLKLMPRFYHSLLCNNTLPNNKTKQTQRVKSLSHRHSLTLVLPASREVKPNHPAVVVVVWCRKTHSSFVSLCVQIDFW